MNGFESDVMAAGRLPNAVNGASLIRPLMPQMVDISRPPPFFPQPNTMQQLVATPPMYMPVGCYVSHPNRNLVSHIDQHQQYQYMIPNCMAQAPGQVQRVPTITIQNQPHNCAPMYHHPPSAPYICSTQAIPDLVMTSPCYTAFQPSPNQNQSSGFMCNNAPRHPMAPYVIVNSAQAPPTNKQALASPSSNLDSWNNAVIDMDRMMAIRQKVGLLINQRFLVRQKVSFGSYGTIYAALDLKDGLQHVAVKFETTMEDAHLQYEFEVYRVLSGGPRRRRRPNQKIIGVPKVYWYGEEFGQRMLVMTLLGPSLENLFSYCDRSFCRETITSLGHQMIDRLEWLHERGFVHRDLKPENFLMGIGNEETTLFLIDFGLARRYRFRDNDKLCHIPHRKGKSLVGTAKYASLNSHLGMELSRRDDVESFAYILVELCCGELPWKESKNKGRYRTKQQSYNRIRNIKESIDWKTVCAPLAELIQYAKNLDFTEDPDYTKIRSFIDGIMTWMGGEDQPQISPAQSIEDEMTSLAEETDKVCNITANDVDASMVWNDTERQQNLSGKLFTKCRWQDASKRYNWLIRRDSSSEEKYKYQCLFRWTLPQHCSPEQLAMIRKQYSVTC